MSYHSKHEQLLVRRSVDAALPLAVFIEEIEASLIEFVDPFKVLREVVAPSKAFGTIVIGAKRAWDVLRSEVTCEGVGP